MDEYLIAELRLLLAENLDDFAGLPAWWHLFAERPAESAEILERLFAEYDVGAGCDAQIRTLLLIRRSTYKYVSLRRTAALELMDAYNNARHDANSYPPTARRKLHLGMLGVVHQLNPSDACEALVRDHPGAAQELLANFVREQRHDHFFDNTVLGVRRDTWPAINVLRSMIVRAEGRRLIDDMEGEM